MTDDEKELVKNAAMHLGRLGGLARAVKLTPERRSEIAREAALKRWGNKKDRE